MGEKVRAALLGELSPDSPEGRLWESLVAINPASGFFQSLLWARIKRRSGIRTHHIGLYRGEKLLGGAILYSASGTNGLGMLIAPDGPVLDWTNEAETREALGALQALAEKIAQAEGAMSLRVEPRLLPPLHPALRGYRRAPVDLLPSETLFLNLTPEPEAILAAMRPKGRYNIRLAGRRGVVVEEKSAVASAYRFHRILKEVGERDDFFVEPLSFFLDLAEELLPSGMARFFFAGTEGEPDLGALLLLTYGRRATYLYGGVTNVRRELMAGYLLQWRAIERARELGCTSYDFYGFEPFGASDHLYAGFSRFKRQFGGQPVRFIGAHDHFFLDQLAGVIIRVARQTEGQID